AVGVVVSSSPAEKVRDGCVPGNAQNWPGVSETICVSENGVRIDVEVRTDGGLLHDDAPLGVINVFQDAAIRLNFARQQMCRVRVSDGIRGECLALVFVFDLGGVRQRDRSQVPKAVVIIMDAAAITGVGLDNVAINVVIESEEIAVAALNSPDQTIVERIGILPVRKGVAVASIVLPPGEVRPLPAEISAERIGPHLERAETSVRGK